MDILRWLSDWYQSNCDGDWEHCYGVKIDTLDNPGWNIKIHLLGTEWEDKEFMSINIDKGDDDWIMCRVRDNVFDGAGDPQKLIAILTTFKNWVEEKRG